VGQAAAEVVRGGIGGQARKDLGFTSHAAKGACVQDAGHVAGKRRAVGMQRLWLCAAGQFAVSADGNPWW
jgi:hypothetical protein